MMRSETSTAAKSNWSGGSGASSAVLISGSFSPVTPRWSRARDEWVSGKTSPLTLRRLPAVEPPRSGSAIVAKWLTMIEQLVDAGRPFDDRRMIMSCSRLLQPLIGIEDLDVERGDRRKHHRVLSIIASACAAASPSDTHPNAGRLVLRDIRKEPDAWMIRSGRPCENARRDPSACAQLPLDSRHGSTFR